MLTIITKNIIKIIMIIVNVNVKIVMTLIWLTGLNIGNIQTGPVHKQK